MPGFCSPWENSSCHTHLVQSANSTSCERNSSLNSIQLRTSELSLEPLSKRFHLLAFILLHGFDCGSCTKKRKAISVIPLLCFSFSASAIHCLIFSHANSWGAFEIIEQNGLWLNDSRKEFETTIEVSNSNRWLTELGKCQDRNGRYGPSKSQQWIVLWTGPKQSYTYLLFSALHNGFCSL